MSFVFKNLLIELDLTFTDLELFTKLLRVSFLKNLIDTLSMYCACFIEIKSALYFRRFCILSHGVNLFIVIVIIILIFVDNHLVIDSHMDVLADACIPGYDLGINIT